MRLESIHVRNLRSIEDAILDVDSLTALVGANGVGKSSFLRALQAFYPPGFKVGPEDCYAGDLSREVSVTLRFANLSPSLATKFSAYVLSDAITIERVLLTTGQTSNRYFGHLPRHPSCDEIRKAIKKGDRAVTAKGLYEALRASPPFDSLPPPGTIAALEAALSKWEASNPLACAPTRDDGSFFGFGPTFQGDLRSGSANLNRADNWTSGLPGRSFVPHHWSRLYVPSSPS